MTEGSADLVFRQDRLKQFGIFLGSAVLVALGYWLATADPTLSVFPREVVPFIGWLCMVVSAVTGLNALAQAIKPTTLTVHDGGFRIERWRGSAEIAWSDVSEVWSSTSSMVTWRLHDGAKSRDVMRALNGLFGYDGSLVKGWDQHPRTIAARMKERKARFEEQTN